MRDLVKRVWIQRAIDKKTSARGFSLIEIMIVLVLIGLIMAAAGIALMGQLKTGEIKSARNQAYEISKALDVYRLNFGHYPTQSEGLQILVTPPSGEAILERLPKDPWGSEFIYVYPGEKNKNKPDVRSKGPDGIENSDDDIGNWPADEK